MRSGPKIGYRPSKETKAKISASLIGRTFSEERKATHKEAAIECQNRPEVKEKKSNSLKRYNEEHPNLQGGENNATWIPDRTQLDSQGYPIELRDMDTLIREHGVDCEECGKSEVDNGRRLDRHHMDENKSNSDLDNFRLLCISCHARLHAWLRRQILEE